MKGRNPVVAVLLVLVVGGCADPQPEQSVDVPQAAAADDRRQSVPRMPVQEISADVAVFSGFSNGNVLAVRLGEGTLLVDAQSAQRVDELADSLRAVGFTEPVRTVVNTHYHTDHVGGNAHWRALGAAVWAHASVPDEMGKELFIEEMDWRRTPEPEEAMPTDFVEETVELGSADEPVVVRHFPRAHTGGDLVVWLPGFDVLHMGDIVEIDADPLVDRWAGGSLTGMIEAVRWAVSTSGPDTVIVPGHGPLIDRDRLERYLRELEAEAARCASGLSGFGCV